MIAEAPTLLQLRQALAAHQPAILAIDRPHAAVAMVLTDSADGPEVLFIVRAPHAADPWSGNLAFPGGRVAAGDANPQQTAERESREELALNLAECTYIGRLDDLYGRTLPILVSAFVYVAPRQPPLSPNHEIARSFWFPLAELAAPQRHRLETFAWHGQPTTQAVVELLPLGQPLLWGITYRLLGNLFAIIGRPFGANQRPTPQQA